MAKKNTLMTPEELEMLMVMDIPPKRGTPAYDAMKAAIEKTKDTRRRGKEDKAPTTRTEMSKGFKKGGKVKSSASKRADGVAKKGKTRGRVV